MPLTKEYIQNSGFSPDEQVQLWKMARLQAVDDEKSNQRETGDEYTRLGVDTAVDAGLSLLPFGIGRIGKLFKGGRNLVRGFRNANKLPVAGKTMADAAKNASVFETAQTANRASKAFRVGEGARKGMQTVGRAVPIVPALTAGALAASYFSGGEEEPDQGEQITPEMLALAQRPGNQLNLASGVTPKDVLAQNQDLVQMDLNYREPMGPMEGDM